MAEEDRDQTTASSSFDRRVAEIRSRLPDAGGKGAVGPGAPDSAGMAAGFRIVVELVAAVAVGTGIGWLLDGWLGTRPLMLVVFVLLGAAAGVMNVYRTAKELDRAAKARRAAALAARTSPGVPGVERETGRE